MVRRPWLNARSHGGTLRAVSESRIRRLLLAGSLLTTLLLCEGIARFAQPARTGKESPFVHDPLLQYRLRPGFSHEFTGPGGIRATWVTSSRGFRGPEFEEAKEEGTTRVVVLGDSVAFGYFNGEEATIASLLQEELRGRGMAAEVINAGVPGYVSLQSLILLELEILDWRPDLIFLLVGWNDAALGYRNDWSPARTLQMAPTRSREPEEPTLVHHLDAALRKASALYAFLRSRRPSPAAVDGGEARGASESETIFAPPAAPVNERAVAAYGRNLESIAAICRSRGIDLLVATWPSYLDGEVPPSVRERIAPWLRPLGVTLPTVAATWRRYTAEIRELPAAPGLEILDLERILSAIEDRIDLFADPVHLLDEGNRVVSAELGRRIAAEGGAPEAGRPGAGLAAGQGFEPR